ncbi:MAG TPA: thiolase family protein [Candidatus Bathyarchaeia archaeon]|nr:thiolase family protein [Candidatus Bathyarchaeia archaeon]
MEEVCVIGVGMHRFGIWRDVPLATLARTAGRAALADAGISFRDVEAAWVGHLHAPAMKATLLMKEFGLTGLPVTRVEAASATGSVAFREAYLAIAGGHCEVAMALGVDKFTDLTGGQAPRQRRDIEATILPVAFFAMWATRRMHDRGTRPEHLARIAAKNWNHGALAPMSHRQPDHRITVEEVLASKVISEPLTAMMCCPVDDGAACAILARKDVARRLQPGRPLVTVKASVLRSETYTPGHTFLGAVVGPAQMTADTARAAYERSGIDPADVSLVHVHDAFAIEELEYYELLGLCRPGEAEGLLESGATEIGGRVPFSTDGGLLARGHPGGPTGLAQIHETVQQLRGEAGKRQVANARIGLCHLVGGGSVCCINLLQRE